MHVDTLRGIASPSQRFMPQFLMLLLLLLLLLPGA
jgi:hypothetical protein